MVFLANPGKNVTWTPSVHINRTGDTPRGYFVIESKKTYTSEILGQPLNWIKYSTVEQQYLDAEEARLLYVAATRAKNLLVVSTYPAKVEASPWQSFNGHLSGAPELEEGEEFLKGIYEASGLEISRQDLADARKSFPSPDSPSAAPSYSVASVTSVAKGGGEGPGRKSTGRGMSWGRVVHRVLEACAKKTPSNLGLFVENVLAEEGRTPEEREQVLILVSEILISPLWQRLLKSKKRFMEVPFSVKAGSGEYGFDGEAVLSGVIDLVFLEEDGWVIVDYKTDTVENDAELGELVKFYTPQIEMYRKFWEGMAGANVREVGLYFTHLKRWVVV